MKIAGVDSGQELLLSPERPERYGDRHPSAGLEPIHAGVCVPSISNDGTDSQQNLPMQSENALHCDKSMETKGPVLTPGQDPPCEVTTQSQDSAGCGGFNLRPKNPIWRQDKVCRMEVFWRGRPQLGRLSVGACSMVQSSWACTTQENYGLGFRYYSDFCQRNELDGFIPDPVTLVNFLQYEFEEHSRPYNTLNNLRSSVSSTLGPCLGSGSPVGQDPLVCR